MTVQHLVTGGLRRWHPVSQPLFGEGTSHLLVSKTDRVAQNFFPKIPTTPFRDEVVNCSCGNLGSIVTLGSQDIVRITIQNVGMNC